MVNQIICGDALGSLKQFPNDYFQCCITSPPYWGLRDYGIPYQIGAELKVNEYIDNLQQFNSDEFEEFTRRLSSILNIQINDK